MKYFMIGGDDAVLGFGMVGVEGRVAENADEAQSALQEALSDRQVGIVIITEPVAELIRPQVDRYVFSQSFPLIVEIPDRQGPLEGRPTLREMVNQAIGINL
ncbi:MAG: V-type ATP synthase subunit F [Spirochaetaceae bacterium]|nr:V-type ATP synthase subunit F [Spirochaetaceae bacterium]MCF7947651.1 V-type ATP synthase subunit F [Spirochaetia bacterium]MCF7951375.1 V-type ATP synthase subunit F [Spirochaetaceae bacterium]